MVKGLVGLLFVVGTMFADSLSLTPTTGSIPVEQITRFSFNYTGNLGGISLAIIGQNGGNTCYIAYEAQTRQVFVADDGATVWAYQGVLGSSALVQNNQCAVSLGSSTVSSAGSTMTVNLALSFTRSFSGDRYLFTSSWNAAGYRTAWQQVGIISVVLPALMPAPISTDNGLDSEESSFLNILNNYRAQNGVAALHISTPLESSSRWMSNDMATNNRFSHTDSLGRDPFTRMAAFGYSISGTSSGENLAAGNSGAQASFDQWLNACDADATGACTYAHRMNMLNGSYHAIGIARAYSASSSYRWYWTTDFGGI